METIIFDIHRGVLVQTSKTTERFFMAEYRHCEPIVGIDAEIKACSIITNIRTAHREIGIEKDCRAYDYMKLAVMEKIEKGIELADKHEFKHYNEEIKIHLN